MTNQLQQELKSKLKEGITPSQIKKMGAFVPILTKLSLNNLNNLGNKKQHSEQAKPSSTINEPQSTTNDNWLSKYWKQLLIVGGIAVIGYWWLIKE